MLPVAPPERTSIEARPPMLPSIPRRLASIWALYCMVAVSTAVSASMDRLMLSRSARCRRPAPCRYRCCWDGPLPPPPPRAADTENPSDAWPRPWMPCEPNAVYGSPLAWFATPAAALRHACCSSSDGHGPAASEPSWNMPRALWPCWHSRPAGPAGAGRRCAPRSGVTAALLRIAL